MNSVCIFAKRTGTGTVTHPQDSALLVLVLGLLKVLLTKEGFGSEIRQSCLDLQHFVRDFLPAHEAVHVHLDQHSVSRGNLGAFHWSSLAGKTESVPELRQASALIAEISKSTAHEDLSEVECLAWSVR